MPNTHMRSTLVRSFLFFGNKVWDDSYWEQL